MIAIFLLMILYKETKFNILYSYGWDFQKDDSKQNLAQQHNMQN